MELAVTAREPAVVEWSVLSRTGFRVALGKSVSVV